MGMSPVPCGCHGSHMPRSLRSQGWGRGHPLGHLCHVSPMGALCSGHRSYTPGFTPALLPWGWDLFMPTLEPTLPSPLFVTTLRITEEVTLFYCCPVWIYPHGGTWAHHPCKSQQQLCMWWLRAVQSLLPCGVVPGFPSPGPLGHWARSFSLSHLLPTETLIKW